jgi:molecular chaperone GrpE
MDSKVRNNRGKGEGNSSPKPAEEKVEVKETEILEEEEAKEAETACEEAEDSSSVADENAAEIARLTDALQEAEDKYLRLKAEWDNFRRRISEERAAEKARATERLIEGLLPVIDDMDRAIDHAELNGTDDQALLDGIVAVRVKFNSVLEKEALKAIDPIGEAFDANKHQAIAREEDSEVLDETVVKVYQKGYELGNKVIRPAMVVVSTGGPAREAE